MPSGAGLLPPTLFENAHKMDASQAAPQTPVAPFSGRNLYPSYAAFGAGRPPTPAPSPVPDSGTQAAAAATDSVKGANNVGTDSVHLNPFTANLDASKGGHP